MKKALAQNPNLLRTLIGLSLTLIFLLSYAVYGATVSPSVYMYETEASTTEHTTSGDEGNIERTYDGDANTTTWAWPVTMNGNNLTWVNVTASELSSGSVVRIINVAKLYSHPLLGNTYDLENPLEEEFSCADLCDHLATHVREPDANGEVLFHALTSTDPARRSNGSVFAQDLGEAEIKARALIAYDHFPALLRIEVVEQGNRTTNPTIEVETVNEAFANVEVFTVDTATEFLWALAAVVGCFAMVLVPSFTVYFAARAKERRDEAKLVSDEQSVQESLQTPSTKS